MTRNRPLLVVFCAAICAAPALAILWPRLAGAWALSPQSQGDWLHGLMAALALLAVLSWRLNQNRLAVVAMGLAVSAYWGMGNSGPDPGDTAMNVWLLAWPSGLGLSLLPKEGALISGRTALRVLLLSLPLALAWAAMSTDPREFQHWLDWRVAGPPASHQPSHLALLSLLVFAGAVLFRLHSRIEAAIMALGGSLLGLTAVVWASIAQNAWSGLQPRVWLAAHLAQAACLALGLFLLYWQRVYIDELTAVANRRALDERLSHMDGPYALAMVDIDHFKRFNDTYGHDQGDDVLRLVAHHLAEGTKGLAYRYGGEEFCVLAPGLDSAQLHKLMDRVRGDLSDRRFHIRLPKSARKKTSPKDRGKPHPQTEQVQVTVSVGVAQRDKKRNEPAQVLKLADEGLYEAKEHGRDQTVKMN